MRGESEEKQDDDELEVLGANPSLPGPQLPMDCDPSGATPPASQPEATGPIHVRCRLAAGAAPGGATPTGPGGTPPTR